MLTASPAGAGLPAFPGRGGAFPVNTSPNHRWRLRIVALLLALLPTTFLVVSADQRSGQAFVGSPATLPASLAAGLLSTPALVGVAGIAVCVVYCDDAWRWLQKSWQDWNSKSPAPGQSQMFWRQQPDPAAGPVGRLGGPWLPVFTPEYGSGPPYDYNVHYKIRSQCQAPDGTLLDTGWAFISFQTASDTPSRPQSRIVPSDKLCNSDTYAAQVNKSALYLYGVQLRQVDSSVSDESTTAPWPGGPVGAHIEWRTDPKPVTSQTTGTCLNVDTGATTTATGAPSVPAPVVASGDLSAPLPVCPDGSILKDLTTASGVPEWGPLTPQAGPGFAITDQVVNDYRQCLVPGTTCGTVKRVLDPASNAEVCMWGPYVMPMSDCTAVGAPAPGTPTSPATPAPTSPPSPGTTPGPTPPPGFAPSPQQQPYVPTPEELGGVTDGTVTNPDGSTTTTVTNPDGTRTVTTTYPDGRVVIVQLSRAGTVTTVSVLYPDGTLAVTTPNPATGGTTVTVTSPDGSTVTRIEYGPRPSGSTAAPPVVSVSVTQGSGLPTSGSNPDPGDGSNCLDAMWSWNPVAWVYTPVKCALRWAFVPSPAALDGVKAAGAGLAGVAPFSYVADSLAWANGLDGAGSCFSVDVSTPWGPQRVVSSCEPGPFERELIAHRSLLTAAMYAVFLLPLAWWAWRQYAPGATGSA